MNYLETFTNNARNKSISRADIFARCLYKAVKAKSEDKVAVAKALLAKAFTPPSNNNKVANGALRYWGYHHAYYELRNTGIKNFLSEEEYKLFNEIRQSVQR